MLFQGFGSWLLCFASVHVSWHSHRLLTTGLQLFLLTTFVDSFLRSRSSQDHEATAMIKAQFMSMWDGIITDPNCRIMIVAATNRPSDIDPAILRRLPCQFNIKKPVRNLWFFLTINGICIVIFHKFFIDGNWVSFDVLIFGEIWVLHVSRF